MHTKLYEAHADILLQSRPTRRRSTHSPEPSWTPHELSTPRLGSSLDQRCGRRREAARRRAESVGGCDLRYRCHPSASEVGQARDKQPTSPTRTPTRTSRHGGHRAVNDLLTVVDQTQRQLDSVNRRIAALDRSSGASASERSALIDQQSTLRQQLDETQVSAALRSGGAQPLSRATVPTTPVTPKPVISGILALFAGALLGAVAALVAEYFDDSISSPRALSRADHGLPVVGAVPAIPGWRNKGEAKLVTGERSGIGGK